VVEAVDVYIHLAVAQVVQAVDSFTTTETLFSVLGL
jgi:hypothetical protein